MAEPAFLRDFFILVYKAEPREKDENPNPEECVFNKEDQLSF